MFAIIMTVVNIIALICVAIGFFISQYTIVDLETWNEIVHFYNENHNDDGEAAGGCGFFWDYISEVEEPEEEEEE